MNGKSLLIIGKVWPEPNSSAAGSRMMQLIDLFLNHGWEITYASAAGNREFSEDLSKKKIDAVGIRINDSSFDAFASNLNPDMVIFDRFMTEEQFGWRVAEQCPEAVRILDTEDIHCLRIARHQAFKEKRGFIESDLFTEHAKREIASIYRCDLSLIISNYEYTLLDQVFRVNDELLHYIPFMLEPINGAIRDSWIPFEERKNFISIGNFLHEPNWDAVLNLKEIIWPRIKAELPQAELNIYGAYPSQKVFQLNNQAEGFLIKGRVEDAKEVMSRARVCLAPLRFGAGLKGKLIEAMQCGTPSVTSTIGAEAMYGNLNWAGEIVDDPGDFVDKSIKLYNDPSLWKNSQENGIQIINLIYPKKELGEILIEKINNIRSNLNLHRHKNFTGAMLMHHTLASTRYMSKWIEEKNK
tara:strand:+ start:26465 stop:27700 length:1236 start_codon:yes stop_codon:yes gene_type:complete